MYVELRVLTRIEVLSNFIFTQQLARGIVAGTDVGITLSVEQCTEIGVHARVSGYYYQAMDWLNAAMNKIIIESGTRRNLEDVQEEFEFAKLAVSTSS